MKLVNTSILVWLIRRGQRKASYVTVRHESSNLAEPYNTIIRL